MKKVIQCIWRLLFSSLPNMKNTHLWFFNGFQKEMKQVG